MRLETNIFYLPVPYRCAIETLGNSGDRTSARLDDLMCHFERVYGLPLDDEARRMRESARAICERRFHDYKSARASENERWYCCACGALSSIGEQPVRNPCKC